MSILDDLLENHFNASIDYFRSRTSGVQPMHIKQDADDALQDAESALETFVATQQALAHKEALNSLCVGVDATETGTGMALMSRDSVSGVTIVLACGFTKAGQENLFRVKI